MDLKLDILDLKQDRLDSRISVTHSNLELRILENVTSELTRVADSESQLESVDAGIRRELARMSQFIVAVSVGFARTGDTQVGLRRKWCIGTS